ncbi:MAG: hypothetical protein KGJ62_10750 [Armatimonadetes bacterium]|nr:hypothetical protein [Armatimonadota bacterium]
MASATPDLQKIHVTLAPADLVIEPGGVAQLTVTVRNTQTEPDRVSFEVEGIDMEWYAIPVPAVNVAPRDSATERIIFRIGRSTDNQAGAYPFLVRVQAMESGEVAVAQASLQIKPFHSLQVELIPKRATSTFFQPNNQFEVSLSNLGNTPVTLDVSATDPDSACMYEFETNGMQLQPGQIQQVELITRPKAASLLSGVRLYGFSVLARSREDGYITATANGQIEKHAMVSPLAGIFLSVLVLCSLGWYLFRPKPLPPLIIRTFSASPAATQEDKDITLTWDVSPGFTQLLIEHRVLGRDATDVVDDEPRDSAGSIHVQPEPPQTIYSLVLRGASGQKEQREQIKVNVQPLPPPPKPVLTAFWADPPICHVGDMVMLTWKGRAANYVLDPGSIHLESIDRSHQVTTDTVGDMQFTLRAYGQDPNTPPSTKTITVHVAGKDESVAKIDRFSAWPAAPTIGATVHLRWHTLYAKGGVKIQSNNGTPIGDANGNVGASGTTVFTITTPTTFTITAVDGAGLPAATTLTITPHAAPPPVSTTPPDTTQPDTSGQPAGGANPPSGSPPP